MVSKAQSMVSFNSKNESLLWHRWMDFHNRKNLPKLMVLRCTALDRLLKEETSEKTFHGKGIEKFLSWECNSLRF